MASIRRRGPHQYQARIIRRGNPDQVKTFKTRSEAEKWTKAEGEKWSQPAQQAAVLVPPAPALREALDRYAREVTPAKKGALQELRRVKYWQGHYLGDRPLDSIRGADLAVWRDERIKRGAGANTIRLDLAPISHLYEVARKVMANGALGQSGQAHPKAQAASWP
jgi:hypothetical protein